MSKIKIYHENGTIKIIKISTSGIEQILFSDLKNGQTAEIDIDCITTTEAKISKSNSTVIVDYILDPKCLNPKCLNPYAKMT